MGKRLDDMLVLVSRVQEKRGDFRFALRQDLAVRPEVHAYMDDLTWLSRRPAMQPTTSSAGVGKSRLIAMLRGQSRPRRTSATLRVLGASATAFVLLAGVLSMQAATDTLPGPVSQALNGFFEHRQATAQPLFTSDGSISSVDPTLSVEPADAASQIATPAGAD